MKMVKTIIREIFGLFIDDQFLALATLVVVGGTAIVVTVTTGTSMVAAMTLLGGCLFVLVAGVWRTARSALRE